MGQVSQVEDEEDRREDARQLGVPELPSRRGRKAGLSKSRDAEWTFGSSNARSAELLRRAAERERWQTEWRKEQSIVRFNDFNVILDKDNRTARPIRTDEPMLLVPAGWTVVTS